jgi:hypothetical protein
MLRNRKHLAKVSQNEEEAWECLASGGIISCSASSDRFEIDFACFLEDAVT